jgi:hypothetical protein
MKKLLISLALVLIFATSLLAVDSTYTITKYKHGTDFVELSLAWTTSDGGDFTAATTTTEETNFIKGRWLCQMITDPVSPTDDYDITVVDANGADLLGGAGSNRDASNSEVTYPIVDSTSGQRACVPVTTALTIDITSAGNSESGVIRLIFR